MNAVPADRDDVSIPQVSILATGRNGLDVEFLIETRFEVPVLRRGGRQSRKPGHSTRPNLGAHLLVTSRLNRSETIRFQTVVPAL